VAAHPAPGAPAGAGGAGGATGKSAATKTAAARGAAPAAAAAGKVASDDKDIPVGTPPADSSPLAELKKSNDQLDKLLKKKYPNWSPEADAQKVAVQKLVGEFLDYRELAH